MVKNFRIEEFGSSEYMSGDIILRNREETLEFLEKMDLHDNYKVDIEKFWDGSEEVSITNLRLPFELLLEYTYKCPLRCKYCYSSSGPERREIMPYEDFQKLIYKISQEEIFELFVCGGEPFWDHKYIKYLLENVEDKSIIISTNGILLDEECCKWIKSSKNKIIISLGIDGHNAEIHNSTRGGFEKMCNALSLLNKYEIPIVATTCVTDYSFEHLDKIAEFLISNNVKSVQLLKCQTKHLPAGLQKELELSANNEIIIEKITNVVEMYKEKINFVLSFRLPITSVPNMADDIMYYGPCTAGITRACVNAKGKLVPCTAAIYPEQDIDDSIGEAYLNLKMLINKNRVSYSDKKIILTQCCYPE